MYHMVRNIEFKTGQNDFQNTLLSDLKKIRSSKNVLVFVDKITNLYEMSPDQYNSLFKNNVTKTYEKPNSSPKLELIKRECYAERHAFMTLKDRKYNFKQNAKCRLINPAKREIGLVSKKYLEQIIRVILVKKNQEGFLDGFVIF